MLRIAVVLLPKEKDINSNSVINVYTFLLFTKADFNFSTCLFVSKQN